MRTIRTDIERVEHLTGGLYRITYKVYANKALGMTQHILVNADDELGAYQKAKQQLATPRRKGF